MANVEILNWSDASAELEKLDRIFMNISEKADIHINSNPAKVPIHWEKTVDDGFTKMVVCPGSGCPLCKVGSKITTNYRFSVLDRGTKLPKIVTAGKMLFKAIGDFARTHGNPCDYDLRITKKGSGKDTRYFIEPRKIALSDDEKKMFTPDILSLMTAPTSEETIQQMNLEVLSKTDEEWKAFEKSFEK